MRVLIASTALFAASVTSAAVPSSRPLSVAEKAVVEHAVRAQLSDPDSATFRHNPYQTASERYCALVNAKNRLGGYIGYRLFSIQLTDKGTSESRISAVSGVSIPDRADNELVWMLTESACHVDGYKTAY